MQSNLKKVVISAVFVSSLFPISIMHADSLTVVEDSYTPDTNGVPPVLISSPNVKEQQINTQEYRTHDLGDITAPIYHQGSVRVQIFPKGDGLVQVRMFKKENNQLIEITSQLVNAKNGKSSDVYFNASNYGYVYFGASSYDGNVTGKFNVIW
ncbi:hypothetical protein [Paenibacillus wulumuqiensis]|uniref:hypothetical protein n=1 Tax=Paenibacillus wulumuqiensis TaxID=1567107 RepID=UPI0006198916|nr:hypothetical protein [Paenibacillus wulumuqiensis]